MNRTENLRTPNNTIRPPTSPRLSPRASPRKNRQSIGCYTKPPSHSPPPSFGPNSVPPAVASQLDSYFEEKKKEKKERKARLKKASEQPPEDEPEETKPTEEEEQVETISDRFSLCIPQSPQRFSRRQVKDPSNHPSKSILQNPQRIVANGPFAITEPVKQSVVSLQFDGLQPLRLNNTISNPDAKKTLRDLLLLVQASIRSHDTEEEASAYFNIALIYESEGHLKRANEYYMKYIHTLGEDADPLAFNRIAVNYQLLHQYNEAIEWNLKHLSFGRSMFETIAANCNIALIYKELGDINKSIQYYTSALETASEMDDTQDSLFYNQIQKIKATLTAQIELANSEAKVRDLGVNKLASYSFGDRLERIDTNQNYIEAQEDYFNSEASLAKENGDLSTYYKALVNCGKLNCVYGMFEKAEEYYSQALKVAFKIGSDDLINHSKVAIGICRGNSQLKEFGLFDGSKDPDVSLFTRND
ncbi:hypothetical protein M9Y10_015025 [Tritrichomonas musculus]|uniref:Tetratricopeptide repeat protein 29 n=1 Tax=Tritrichomonas musculus TaxID=1915356 RepID=A0ABR2L273_9EUKA